MPDNGAYDRYVSLRNLLAWNKRRRQRGMSPSRRMLDDFGIRPGIFVDDISVGSYRKRVQPTDSGEAS